MRLYTKIKIQSRSDDRYYSNGFQSVAEAQTTIRRLYTKITAFLKSRSDGPSGNNGFQSVAEPQTTIRHLHTKLMHFQSRVATAHLVTTDFNPLEQARQN